MVAGSRGEAQDVFHRASDLLEQRILHLWHENDDHRLDGVFSAEKVLAKGNAFVGTADSVRDEIVAQIEASGMNYLALSIIFGDIGLAEATATARAVADHVAPATREAAQKTLRLRGFPVV